MTKTYGILFKFTETDNGSHNILTFENKEECLEAHKEFTKTNQLIKDGQITVGEYRKRAGRAFGKASNGLQCIKTCAIRDGIYKASHVVWKGEEMGRHMKSEGVEVIIINPQETDLEIIG